MSVSAAERSQYIAGGIALCNYLMAATWPTDAHSIVMYLSGALVAAVTGWKAPSAVSSVARVLPQELREDYRGGVARNVVKKVLRKSRVIPAVSRDRGYSE